MGTMVKLQGSVHYFLVCRFSSESLSWSWTAGDDGVVGIVFLAEGITVRTSTNRTDPGENLRTDILVRAMAVS